jgi:hypothetical protein
VKAWDRLDEGGRRVALDVIDHAPCSIRSPLYLRALFGPHAAHRIHARERLRSCGEEAAKAIEATLATAPRRAHPLLVTELALVGPERAVRVAVPLFAPIGADASFARGARTRSGESPRSPRCAGARRSRRGRLAHRSCGPGRSHSGFSRRPGGAGGTGDSRASFRTPISCSNRRPSSRSATRARPVANALSADRGSCAPRPG